MNKHDEIKKLLKASKNMLSNIDTINETLDIRKQYNLITEQGRVSTSGDVTKKIDVGDAIEDEIEDDEKEYTDDDEYLKVKKSPKDKSIGWRISGGQLYLHGKDKRELKLTSDEKIAFQETMNEFVNEVSDLVEFNRLNLYPNNVEWSGKIIEFDLDFIFRIGEKNGLYIKADMINADDDFEELMKKLKTYYQKFKSKWSKVLGNRKITKTSDNTDNGESYERIG
jgi:hypothetical protein